MYHSDRTKKFQINAFEVILKKSLSLKYNSDESLTIIYDEDFFKMFNSLSNVITNLKIPATYIFIPKSYQTMLINNKDFFDENNEINLPPQINVAIQNSTSILNFLNGDSKYSKIRGAIINLRKRKHCKMVHSPGISNTSVCGTQTERRRCMLCATNYGNRF